MTKIECQISNRTFIKKGSFKERKHYYRISANSFRGNCSFLNLTLCTVSFGDSTYRCGNYLREETIQGRKLFAEIRYSTHKFSERTEWMKHIDLSNFLELYISVKNIALQWFGIVIIFIITSFELLCIAIK